MNRKKMCIIFQLMEFKISCIVRLEKELKFFEFLSFVNFSKQIKI